MSARRVANGIAANVVSFASTVGVQALSVPILVHLWGLPQFGIWIILSTIPSYLILSNFGLALVTSNEMAAALARGERERARALYSTTAFTITAISLVLMIAGVAIAAALPADAIPAAQHVDPEELRTAVIALVIYGVLGLNTELAIVPYRATGGYARGTFIVSLIALAERLALLAAAIFGLGAAAIAMVCVRAAGVAYMLLRAWLAHPDLRPRWSDASLSEAKRIAKLGFGMILYTLAMAINLQGPILVLGIMIAPAAVALFSATRTLTRFGLQATSVVSSSVMAEFALASGESDDARRARLFAFNVAVGAVLLAGTVGFLLLFGPQLTYLWLAKAARPEFLLVALLALGTGVQGMWVIAASLLMASNRQYTFTPILVAVAFAMIGVGGVVAATAGVTGMAAVILAAELVTCAWVFRQAARHGIGRLSDVRATLAATYREWQARRSAARPDS